MNYLTGHWTAGPWLIVALLVAVWHEAGLWRLARAEPDLARGRRLRALWFYAGLVVALVALQSPIAYWSYDYFFVHMLQHLLLMFAAPSLIVAGAPWQPLAIPWLRVPPLLFTPLRFAVELVMRPWVSIALFNGAMILWHLPGPYDLAERNWVVHTWLMYGTFLAAGVCFWLQFIPSPPVQRRMPLLSQAAGLIATNLIMIGLAMALSIFASHSVYSVYNHIPGVTLPAFADQQIGAAILWVCGDFWAVPTMIVIIRRLVETEGGVGEALDRMLGVSGQRRRAWGREP
jgi:putative membrane protein